MTLVAERVGLMCCWQINAQAQEQIANGKLISNLIRHRASRARPGCAWQQVGRPHSSAPSESAPRQVGRPHSSAPSESAPRQVRLPHSSTSPAAP
eukprot:364844-Chlamydomonas_euryale.AAC.4